ncbi:MaoC/PaaZ C-terminal domain-containing protein [Massilia eburnea]|nr:MaoC/PaaZ C-terminal domain-containing protein [Massilia eburnea]
MTQLQILPEAGAATLLRALFKGPVAAGAPEIPRTAFRLERLDNRQIKRYNALLGFAADALPLSFYYLPTQRAHLATMLGAEFPFRLAGMIHVENEIRELRAPDRDRAMEIVTNVTIEPPAENGARYCELHTMGKQQEQDIFECRSRYLAVRGKRRTAGGERGSAAVAPAAGQPAGEWSLAANAGRQYASVSGDWNPIHLWPWSARLLGMKTPIIHGMHTVAKAAAMLEQRESRRLKAITARFKAPIPLGAAAELRLLEPAGSYQVWTGGTLAVEGRFG